MHACMPIVVPYLATHLAWSRWLASCRRWKSRWQWRPVFYWRPLFVSASSYSSVCSVGGRDRCWAYAEAGWCRYRTWLWRGSPPPTRGPTPGYPTRGTCQTKSEWSGCCCPYHPTSWRWIAITVAGGTGWLVDECIGRFLYKDVKWYTLCPWTFFAGCTGWWEWRIDRFSRQTESKTSSMNAHHLLHPLCESNSGGQASSLYPPVEQLPPLTPLSNFKIQANVSSPNMIHGVNVICKIHGLKVTELSFMAPKNYIYPWIYAENPGFDVFLRRIQFCCHWTLPKQHHDSCASCVCAFISSRLNVEYTTLVWTPLCVHVCLCF